MDIDTDLRPRASFAVGPVHPREARGRGEREGGKGGNDGIGSRE